MSRAPRDNEQIAVGIASGNDVRDILDDGFDFCGANANHVFVVQRFVVDVASDVLFFEATDAMFETRRAGDGPRTRERVTRLSVATRSVAPRLLTLVRPASRNCDGGPR